MNWTSGCGQPAAGGTPPVTDALLLSGKPPRQAPAQRSTSKRPGRPWLIVSTTSGRRARSRNAVPYAASTMPWSKYPHTTGKLTACTTAGPDGVSRTRPSSCSADAPAGFEMVIPGPSSWNGSKPLTITRRVLPSGNSDVVEAA